MHTYQVTWFGEGAGERVDVCTVTFDPAIIPRNMRSMFTHGMPAIAILPRLARSRQSKRVRSARPWCRSQLAPAMSFLTTTT
jgi:hypothetical protein